MSFALRSIQTGLVPTRIVWEEHMHVCRRKEIAKWVGGKIRFINLVAASLIVSCIATRLPTSESLAAVAVLPQSIVDVTMPAAPAIITVCSSGCTYKNSQLQAAIDAAVPGTTIQLKAGEIYQSPPDDKGFILRNKAGAGWIVIRTSTPDSQFAPPGERLTVSDAPKLPKLERTGTYGMTCEPNAHNYRLIGLEFRNPGNGATGHSSGALIHCGRFETTVDDQPHHIVFDRLYVHGPSLAGQDVRFGVILQGRHQAVIDSWISDIKHNYSEANAIASWGAAGPLRIEDNYIEGSSINILIGGADPLVPNLTPSDITIVKNTITKPLRWKNLEFAFLSVKNLLELKHAQRVLVEGNTFEGVWPDAQAGFAFMLTPRQGSGVGAKCGPAGSPGCAPWTIVQDVTIRNNKVKAASNGVAISGRDPGGPYTYATRAGRRFTIRNNILEGLGGYPGTGIAFAMANGPGDVTITHNTVVKYNATNLDGKGLDLQAGSPSTSSGFVFQNNILPARKYPLFGFIGGCSSTALVTYTPGFQWTHNAIAGPWPTPAGCTVGILPGWSAENAFPVSEAAIGYENYSSGMYRLTSASPFKAAGSDGKDLGVDYVEYVAVHGL